jgi:radical SAM superfamily enzyme YgiQ (UPF0313 family)
MKVQLIGPVKNIGRKEWKSLLFPLPSLSLPMVAACVPEEYEVEINGYFQVMDGDDVIDDAITGDMVGLSIQTMYAGKAKKITDVAHKKGSYVIHGGIHPSLNPESSDADTIIIGHAENTLGKFFEDYAKGDAKKQYIDDNKSTNLKLKSPRRDLFPKTGLSKIWDYVSAVEYSRGCPNDCEYCCVPSFSRRRTYVRDDEDVINEISELPQKHIFFTSNNLVTYPERFKEFMKELAPLERKWIGAITPDSVVDDPEMLNLMKMSGCEGIFLGFESLSDEYLKHLGNKKKHVEKYSKAMRMFNDIGIAVNGSFMFGSDYDDESVFDNVLEFVNNEKIPLVSSFISTPFPGTQLHKRIKDEGRILTDDLSKYDLYTVVFQPKILKPEQLQEGFEKFYKELYSFGNLTTRMNSSFTFKQPWTILVNLGYATTVKLQK